MSCANLTWFLILPGFVGAVLSFALLLLRASVCALLSARFCLARFCYGAIPNNSYSRNICQHYIFGTNSYCSLRGYFHVCINFNPLSEICMITTVADQHVLIGAEEGIYTLNLNEIHENTMELVRSFNLINFFS